LAVFAVIVSPELREYARGRAAVFRLRSGIGFPVPRQKAEQR